MRVYNIVEHVTMRQKPFKDGIYNTAEKEEVEGSSSCWIAAGVTSILQVV